MDRLDVYLYGMTVWSTIHLLDGEYPEADTYGEIWESYTLPGGETGNSAVVLSKLGLKTKIHGPFLGVKTREDVTSFYSQRGIDCSAMEYDPTFDGVQDLVLVGGNTRTVFGSFAHYFSGKKRWSKPDRQAIEAARIVSVDPFFGEESELVAKTCVEAGKRYVTIDCAPESYLHRNAAATVVSNEYIRNEFSGVSMDELYKRYTENGKGLVIFTFGAKEILYGRKGTRIGRVVPYKVEVKSTLGAGDTFRGGVVYALLNDMDDVTAVKFAAALSGCVCKRFPMAMDPPELSEILSLMETQSNRE